MPSLSVLVPGLLAATIHSCRIVEFDWNEAGDLLARLGGRDQSKVVPPSLPVGVDVEVWLHGETSCSRIIILK